MTTSFDTKKTSAFTHLRVLIVDDDCGIREPLKNALEARGVFAETAASGEEAIHQLRQADLPFHALITDFQMNGLNGFDVLKELKRISPKTRAILMTAYGNIPHAVEAMKLGADEYLAKPFAIEELERLLLKIDCGEGSAFNSTLNLEKIISEDPSFRILLQKAERASKSSAPILIEGPSGTGKELLARQIHDWSQRRNKPWVAINCAALPQGLLESELFGYEKGAFTGAAERKTGRFEQASGGTLLLDEIGELDLQLQAKLLRVLQEGEVDRLGGKKALKVDVRIIATTNRSLEQLVRKGLFREDLFFRLYGVRLTLPALKDRPRDIEILAKSFLARQSEILGRELSFTDEVLPALIHKPWPGNVRELERSVERAAVMTENGFVSLHHFEFTDDRLMEMVPTARTREEARELASAIQPQKSIREMEQDIILRALDAHQGNRTHTAKSLGMSLRTLRHKLKGYRDAGIQVDRQDLVGKNDPSDAPNATLTGFSNASNDGIKLASVQGGNVFDVPASNF